MPIHLIGLNHNTAPVALRERLYFGGHALAELLPRVVAADGVAEAVVLSTCNRTEIIVAGSDTEAVVVLLAACGHIDAEELRTHLYQYKGRAAVSHLFRVACGLDSLMIGEMQIQKQVRDALECAQQCCTAGRYLAPLLQHAVAVGKRARAETVISEGAFSVGRAGVELARSLFPDLAQSPVLVLGAGKMSELTARHLASNGVQAVFVANRTHAHAVELAERLGGQAIFYEELEQYLATVDILISSTSAPHHVLHAADVARVMARRGGRALCLIDIAMPRDIDPAAAELPDVHLYNIDDLRGIAEGDRCRRLAEVPAVEAIINDEVERWQTREAGLDAAGVISDLHHAFEQARRTELERIKLILGDLTPEQQAAVEAMTTSLINKLLHTPTVRLKETLAHYPERRPHVLLRELFALSDDPEGERR